MCTCGSFWCSVDFPQHHPSHDSKHANSCNPAAPVSWLFPLTLLANHALQNCTASSVACGQCSFLSLQARLLRFPFARLSVGNLMLASPYGEHLTQSVSCTAKQFSVPARSCHLYAPFYCCLKELAAQHLPCSRCNVGNLAIISRLSRSRRHTGSIT